MQLFRLDNDPQLAAQYHADFHVNKLLLEATQILNQALREQGHEDYAFYGSTHSGHTCIEWVKESDGNFAWVLQLIYHLQQEKQHRWQSGPHTSFEKIQRHWFDRSVFSPSSLTSHRHHSRSPQKTILHRPVSRSKSTVTTTGT